MCFVSWRGIQAKTLKDRTFADVLIITTSQRATQDLVRVGESIELEKDQLLEKVTALETQDKVVMHVASLFKVAAQSLWHGPSG